MTEAIIPLLPVYRKGVTPFKYLYVAGQGMVRWAIEEVEGLGQLGLEGYSQEFTVAHPP